MAKPGANAVKPPPSTLQFTRRDLLAGGCGVLGGLSLALWRRIASGDNHMPQTDALARCAGRKQAKLGCV